MSTTQDIANTLGRQAMADSLGIGLTAISNRVVAGKFPASWYLVVKKMCEEAQIECPPSLFGMKSTTGGSYHEGSDVCQSSPMKSRNIIGLTGGEAISESAE